MYIYIYIYHAPRLPQQRRRPPSPVVGHPRSREVVVVVAVVDLDVLTAADDVIVTVVDSSITANLIGVCTQQDNRARNDTQRTRNQSDERIAGGCCSDCQKVHLLV